MGLASAPFKIAGKVANETVNPVMSGVASSIAKPMVRRAVDRATDDRGEISLDSPLGRHRLSDIKVDPKLKFSFDGLTPKFSTSTHITLNDELTIPRSRQRIPQRPAPQRPAATPTQSPQWQPGYTTPPRQTPFEQARSLSVPRPASIQLGSAPEFNRQMMPPQPTGPLAAQFTKPDRDYFVERYRRPEEDVQR
jgi:hypothetical protein